MPRRRRLDGPGTIHHVFNRGIARRTMFETRSDKRMFLAFVAKAVRRGEIRVLSFCVLTTHDHLLIESVEGGLGGVMQRIQVRRRVLIISLRRSAVHLTGARNNKNTTP